jgi:hypothetical protein
MEFLNRFDTFKKSHAKLVHRHVMDALETISLEQKDTNDPSKTKVVKMLDGIANASLEKRKSGLGPTCSTSAWLSFSLDCRVINREQGLFQLYAGAHYGRHHYEEST